MKTRLPPSIGFFEDLLSIFDYDRELPLNIEEIGVEHRNGSSIHDISYSGLANVKIDVYLEPIRKIKTTEA